MAVETRKIETTKLYVDEGATATDLYAAIGGISGRAKLVEMNTFGFEPDRQFMFVFERSVPSDDGQGSDG